MPVGLCNEMETVTTQVEIVLVPTLFKNTLVMQQVAFVAPLFLLINQTQNQEQKLVHNLKSSAPMA